MSLPEGKIKIAGANIATEPILLALVAAVVGAVILPMIKLNQFFPNQSKWVYGGIWFVIGLVVVAVGYMPGVKGYARSLLVGAGIAFFIAAFLQFMGWTFSK